MTAPKRSAAPRLSRDGPGKDEARFWQLAGTAWRQLGGSFDEAGFSFEWHEWDAGEPLKWGDSFHPHSVEICLNLQGSGWVNAEGGRMELAPQTAGFLATNGGRLSAERMGGQQHQFLSVEFHIPFLQSRLAPNLGDLHPLIRRCLDGTSKVAGVSAVSPLTHRHHDLLRSLLHPPVLASAQRLWYEIKALEFATEFFFSAGEDETLCSRAQRLAAERIARAKRLLLDNLAEPPALEELGRRVGCSHFYLSRTFTRETGLTISQWLRRARLAHAADLLRSRACNVTEAALRVGYSSLSHFSGAFHEMYGCCPGLYPLRTLTQQKGPSTLPDES